MSDLGPPPLQPPPSSFSAHFPPEHAILGLSINLTNCTPNSAEHEPDYNHAKIMENFKGMIFKFAISSCPSKTLSPLQRSLIEQRLDEVFSSFRAPDHPPYTAMIEAAIRKLGEQGTSSEKGISQLLRNEYTDLPWAHDTILKYHLGTLCENGSIVKNSNGFYMLCNVVTNLDSASSPSPTSPCSSIDAYSSFSLSPDCSPSSSCWSDSSYRSSPRPKRKRQMCMRRRKRGIKSKRSDKGKVNCTVGARVAKRRQRRRFKQYMSEDDTEASDEHLLLEEESEEIEENNDSEEDYNEPMEGINQVRDERQSIGKQDHKQETGLIMIEIQLDNHEDMVDECQKELKTRGMMKRKAHLKSTCAEGRKRGRPRKEFSLVENTQPWLEEEMGTDTLYPVKIEVAEEECGINEELAVVEDQDLGRRIMHKTLESNRVEDNHTWSKIGKSESVGEVNKPIKPCNFAMEVVRKNVKGVEEYDERTEHDKFEGIGEQSQLEEYKKLPDQERSNGQKRRGRPPKNSLQRRKFQPEPKRVPGRPRGRPRKKDLSVGKSQENEEQMDTTNSQDPILEDKTEAPVQKYDTNEELTEVVEEHNQSQGNLCETLERSPAEDLEIVKETEKSGPEERKIIKHVDLVIEGDTENEVGTKGWDGLKDHEKFPGSEDKTQLKEPKIDPKQDKRNRQKRRVKLLNRGTKDREVHMKHSRVPGRGRGRPRKKDILVEKPLANAEQTEATDGHEPMYKESTEVPNENWGVNNKSAGVVEDCSALKGNMHGPVEWSSVEKTKIVKEVRSPGPVAEENLVVKLDCCSLEGEQQQDWGVRGRNEQKSNENAFDEEQNQFAEEKNVMTFGKDQLRRRENGEQNQKLEKGLKSVTEKEAEEPEMIGQYLQIQENITSGGKYPSMTKTLLSVNVAQISMDCKAIILAEESFKSVNSVLEEEGEEISNRSLELQREIPREENVLETHGMQRDAIEWNPDSSTAGNSQLKSVERSSQSQYLLQQQQEMTSSYSNCCML